MNRLFVCCAVLSLAALTAAASAQSKEWGWGMGVGGGTQDSGTVSSFEVAQAASDNYDPLDQQLVLGRPAAYCATYHVQGGNGWTGPTGFYQNDARSLTMEPGDSVTWTIYVWDDPTFVVTVEQTEMQWAGDPPAQIDAWLTLESVPSGVSGAPAVGTSWHVSQQTMAGMQLPIFETTNGLDGYVFDLTATVVPEPSSFLALAFGLLPLAAWKRRR